MATIADLVVKIRTDTADAAKGLSSFGSKVRGGVQKAVLPATIALGAMGLAAKIGFKNLQDGARNAKQTEAVLKSTGGAANVTAKHVDSLAMSLRKKAGVDDDVVHAGENMLLTFTNIRNEAGKGNDIFDRSTKIMLDMSHALGQDTTQSAMQLGKALNDPIKGVTALRRVGVAFTEDQTKQIKALTESGHTMEAQKLILHELGKEFGGSATNIDPMTRNLNNMKLNLTDAASGIVTAFLPALSTMIGLVTRATAWLTQHQAVAKAVAVAVVVLAAGILILNAALAIMASPVILVVIALAALVAGLVYAWQTSETFRNIVTSTWEAIKGVAIPVIDWLRVNVPAAWQTILAVSTAVWNAVSAIVSMVWSRIHGVVSAALGAIKAMISADLQIIKGVINVVMGLIQGDWSRVWEGIRQITSGVLNGIVALIRGTIGVAAAAAKALGQAILDGIVNLLKTIGSKVEAAMSSLWSALVGLAGRALRAGEAIGRAILEGVANGIKSAVGGAISAVEGAVGGVLGHAKGLLHINSPSLVFSDGVGRPISEGIGHGITAAANHPKKAIEDAITGALAHGQNKLSEWHELGKGMASAVRTGFSSDPQAILAPFKDAKFATDAWASSKGVDNMTGVGAKMAGALKAGFVGGYQGFNSPLALSGATFAGADGMDNWAANAINGNFKAADLGGNDGGDVYLDGQKVGKVVRSGLYGVKRRTGGLQFEG